MVELELAVVRWVTRHDGVHRSETGRVGRGLMDKEVAKMYLVLDVTALQSGIDVHARDCLSDGGVFGEPALQIKIAQECHVGTRHLVFNKCSCQFRRKFG